MSSRATIGLLALSTLALGRITPTSGAVLSGHVTADGAPLAGAWVQLNTGIVVASDAGGRYSFTDAPRATHAAQVFAPGRQPAVVPGLVPGRSTEPIALEPATTPLGLVHLTATTEGGDPCPVRVVTRWRAGEGDEWQIPEQLALVSTLDAEARPLEPAEAIRPWLVPFGACLWTRGEAMIALPPGQAELTCTAGPLTRAAQQTIEVKGNETTEVAVAMARASDLGALGWTCGALGVRLGAADGRGPYRANLALAAAIGRAEGLDWMVVVPADAGDPAEPNPQQAAKEVGDDSFAVWLAEERTDPILGGSALVLGQTGPLTAGVPYYHALGASRRVVGIYRSPLGDGSSLARRLPFDALADPRTLPVLDLALSSPSAGSHVRLWALLAGHGVPCGCVTLPGGALDRGHVPIVDRTFVRIEGELSLDAVLEGLRRGRTLASTGPVLGFSVADALPGDTLPANDATYVADMDAVLGCIPGAGLARLELLRGGEVVRTWNVSDVGPNHLQARIAVRENRPTWYAVRACGTDEALVGLAAPIWFADPAPKELRPREVRITGRVIDGATGRPVPAARVTASPPGGRPVTAQTREDGSYTIVAQAASLIEATHPRYRPAPDGARFLPWHCPEVSSLLLGATSADLLSWGYYDRVAAAMTSATLDLELAPR